MSWLSEIFSSSAGAIVDSVGTAVDRLVTSDEEKLQLKNELVKIQLEATLKANEQANENNILAQQVVANLQLTENSKLAAKEAYVAECKALGDAQKAVMGYM